MASIKLVTFDLDNTLWNVDKVIVRAETKMRNWMKEYAPESLAFYSSDHLAEIRHSILIKHPAKRFDLSFMRLAILQKVMSLGGLDEKTAKQKADEAFEVFFEASGNKFDIFIKHPRYNERPIEMASGAEKSLSAIAIRLALLGVSSLPTGDIFVLDEPGTALDEENMEGFIRILELIKVYFKNVLLISHLDSLKDCVDMQIVIDKKRGYARVNQ